MTRDGFVHLHVHSEYSMLDGAARLSDLVAETAAQEMPAVAVTDHGNVFGAYEFWKKATGAGVKPIIGIEAYVTPGTHRVDRTRVQWGTGAGKNPDDVSSGGAYTHMTLWAENNTGMANLFRLSSLAWLEGMFYKPRMDREILQTYTKGLIATTGCPSGEVQTRLRLGQYQQALAAAADFRDIFGAGNYFVELMDHGLDIETRVRADLLRLAKDLALPLVATNDLHYVKQTDASAHDALLCVQSKSNLDDPNRFKFNGDGYYLKSATEMRALFAGVPQACDSTLDIAERCAVSFDEQPGKYMPEFPCPPGETAESWFRRELQRGLESRYPRGVPAEVLSRAAYEADVIATKGYCAYFLVVADFIGWAKDHGIRVGPGRGSGAGSMAAYAMRITDLDPLVHGLLFERFLNPERPSMPDFDIDFDERRRGEVIRYVTQKYGDDRVAQIVTYGTIKAKAAVKDSARALGMPFSVGDVLTKKMPPPVMGKDVPLAGLYDPNHSRYSEGAEFREFVAADPEMGRVVDMARGLEGLKRQWGMHAAGVIMSSAPLLDVIPVMKRDKDGVVLTQFDFPTCEELGLVKMDFLGLRNLTIIEDALANIRANDKAVPVLEDLALDDPATFALMQSGDTLGVFQLDGGPMRALLKSMRPTAFADISAVLALYRPGPMAANAHNEYADRKNRRNPVTPIHPDLAEALEPILGETYGLIVYQEQVMEIAQKLAGYTLGAADNLRRAMGKKKREVLAKEYATFEAGMVDRGYSAAAVKALWDVLLPFSDYAFNRSHTAAYGLLAYWTGYLKANYPTEYMAALLTSVGDDADKMALYLAECRRMSIQTLSPDVNDSAAAFAAVGGHIRFGLSAVRNVGAAMVAAVISAREGQGKFIDFPDFLAKCAAGSVAKQAVGAMVKAGAFDSLGHTRAALASCFESMLDLANSDKRHEARGQDSLFGVEEIPAAEVPPLPEWERHELLTFEREMLGLYVSDHPLRGREDALAKASTVQIAALAEEDAFNDGDQVVVAGLLTAITAKKTKKTGDPWALVTVEDLTSAVECLVFPRVLATVAEGCLVRDRLVTIKGKVSTRDGVVKVFAESVAVLAA